VKEELKKALSVSKGDFTEIRLEKEFRTNIIYEKDNLTSLDSSVEFGGIVRTLVENSWGIATFNSVDDLKSKVNQAYQIGKASATFKGEPVRLADVNTYQTKIYQNLKEDFRAVPLEKKRKILEDYNTIILDFDDEIESSKVAYSDSYRELTFVNSEGAYIEQEIPDITLALVAVARSTDSNIQVYHDSIGESAGFEEVVDRQTMAEHVAAKAIELLNAKPVDGGSYSVLLNPKLAGVFIHEAFGHLCEADHFYKNTRLQEVMKLGKKFGPEELNVVDDGYIEGRRGNTKFDDEGVPRQKTYLIKNGKLNSFLHSRETAAKMNQRPTGNGRAVSYRHEPIVRMTNTYIENGEASWEELLSSIEKGIYAQDAYGGQTQLEQFTFSAGYGQLINDGQVGPMVRDVVLTGNIFKTLNNIRAIGNDLKIIGSAGGCGKGGQFPLPVTDGSPHIIIDNLTVGGR